MKKVLILFTLIFLVAASIFAVIPQLISYQGMLLDSGGDPVADGSYLIRFNIYNVESGGTEIWSSNLRQINISGGLLNYNLGDSVSLPDNLFANDTSFWLGVKVGTDVEMVPRTRLTSKSFAYQSLRADSALTLGGQSPSYYLSWSNLTGIPAGFADGTDDVDTDWNNLTNVPLGFADGTDNIGTGDITEVTAGSGLSGGGTSGSVNIYADANYLQRRVSGTGTTSQAIRSIAYDGSVIYSDIPQGDITGVTAGSGLSGGGLSGSVTLNLSTNITSSHTFSGTNSFDGVTNYFDSSMIVNSYGVRIGDPIAPYSSTVLAVQRAFNSANTRYGFDLNISNSGTGQLYGNNTVITKPTGVTGTVYGNRVVVSADGSTRIGVDIVSEGQNVSITTGVSYGIRTYGYDGSTAYGIYASGSSAITNYAGYFSGNVHVNGNLSKASGSFKIDHPLDPANKYLQHSFVESPDMMNIYNGNIVTDNNGYARVDMPDYFDALNKDFRYQLTVIGDFAQVIIADEIQNEQFVIRTDKPNVKVSWQVTGVRKDVWAESNRIEVEIDKPAHELGTYLNPKLYGQPIERHLNYKEMKDQIEHRAKKGASDEEAY